MVAQSSCGHIATVKYPRSRDHVHSHSRAQTHLPARLRFSHACVLRMRQVCSTSSARASLWSCMGGKRLIPLVRQRSAPPDGMTLLRVCGGPAVSCGVRVACMSNIGSYVTITRLDPQLQRVSGARCSVALFGMFTRMHVPAESELALYYVLVQRYVH